MEKIESKCVGCSKENVCKFAEVNDNIREKLNDVLSQYKTNIFYVSMNCAYFEPTKPTKPTFR